MRLRTTAESDTYAYATSPLNFGGLDQEDLFFWMIPMALGRNLGLDEFYSFAVGCFCLWLYKKMTMNMPQGHLVLRATVLMGEWENSDVAKRIPAIRKVCYTLNKFLTNLWLDKGLIPSPSYCNRYEP